MKFIIGAPCCFKIYRVGITYTVLVLSNPTFLLALLFNLAPRKGIRAGAGDIILFQ